MDDEKNVVNSREKVLRGLPEFRSLIRGTLVRYMLTCGNQNCRCHRNKRFRHGPYWYVTVSYAGGKQKRYLLAADQVEQVRRGISVYQKLWRSICRISELNLAALQAEKKRRKAGRDV
ncbi:MAG: DUF6788 family protein [Thermoanaerobaculia bacterium]